MHTAQTRTHTRGQTTDQRRFLQSNISVVAAEQFGEGRADGATVAVDHQLQHVLVQLHHDRRHLFSGHEEDDGEDGHLELRTDADEGAADRFHQTFPAELQSEDVIVFIGLEKDRSA